MHRIDHKNIHMLPTPFLLLETCSHIFSFVNAPGVKTGHALKFTASFYTFKCNARIRYKGVKATDATREILG